MVLCVIDSITVLAEMSSQYFAGRSRAEGTLKFSFTLLFIDRKLWQEAQCDVVASDC